MARSPTGDSPGRRRAGAPVGGIGSPDHRSTVLDLRSPVSAHCFPVPGQRSSLPVRTRRGAGTPPAVRVDRPVGSVSRSAGMGCRRSRRNPRALAPGGGPSVILTRSSGLNGQGSSPCRSRDTSVASRFTDLGHRDGGLTGSPQAFEPSRAPFPPVRRYLARAPHRGPIRSEGESTPLASLQGRSPHHLRGEHRSTTNEFSSRSCSTRSCSIPSCWTRSCGNSGARRRGRGTRCPWGNPSRWPLPKAGSGRAGRACRRRFPR